MAGSPQANKDVVRKFLEILESQDVDALDSVMAGDLRWHGGSLGDLTGLEPFKQMMPAFYAAMPDLWIKEDDMLVEGDKVMVRASWGGTHTGPFFGIPPTGRKVSVKAQNIYRISQGKIVEEWALDDIFGVLQQIGAFPPPGDAKGR